MKTLNRKTKPVNTLKYLGLIALFAFGCTGGSDKEPTKEPVLIEKGEAAARPAPGSPANEGQPPGPPTPPPPPAAPLPPDPCVVLAKLPAEPPVYLPEQKVMLTRLAKPCVTREGLRGYDKATPWMAMGIPCTGGKGKVDIIGASYVRPKVVSFVHATDCPMMPATGKDVVGLVTTAIDLPLEAKFVAYNPFVVQYWEVPGLPDANVGFVVSFVSAAAREGAWSRLREKEPVRVHLYGRENAWVPGQNFFLVEADIKLVDRKVFQLEVVNVTPVSAEEKEKVKFRCESLKPRRNCGRVFN